MTKFEQLELLKKSITEWNQWREKNPDLKIDLSGTNLKEANLQGAILFDAKLQEVNLIGSNLKNAALACANLQNAKLQKANLEESNLQNAKLQKANLDGANLNRADLRVADLEKSNLQGANLHGANLRKADLGDTNLSEVNLRGAKLTRVQNLTCEQINSVSFLDKNTKFPSYLKIEITNGFLERFGRTRLYVATKWTCKEVEKEEGPENSESEQKTD